MLGILGRKLGMTQIFTTEGQWLPVTVLKAGPCVVVSKRTKEHDGYKAIQLGFEEVEAKKKNKPYGGHFLKKKLKVCRVLREFRTQHSDDYTPGDILSLESFEVGDSVHVVGVSKGKGFQGVMKRHHFAGGYASHGCSISHRSGGSIGQNSYPGRVFKGKRMAGRMGGERITVKNLKVVGLEKEKHLILIEGAVPGAKSALIHIYDHQGSFEKRFLENKKKLEKTVNKTEETKAASSGEHEGGEKKVEKESPLDIQKESKINNEEKK